MAKSSHFRYSFCSRCSRPANAMSGMWRSRELEKKTFKNAGIVAHASASRAHLLVTYFPALGLTPAISAMLDLKAYAAPVWIPIFVLSLILVAHSCMRRNRVTELAICGSSVGEEDDGS